MDVIVSYNFYEDYLNNEFDLKMKKRISYLKDNYKIKNISENDFLKEYFVELFSWSVIPKNILNSISDYINYYKLNGIIDPCCGNGFHSYLFKNYCDLNTFTVDIQDEPNSWLPITEKDGRVFLSELELKYHSSSALLLSWIDYESLTIDLLNNYHGNMVISLGNYEKLSPNYLKLLNTNFKLLNSFNLKMPWGLNEKIEVYVKNNI